MQIKFISDKPYPEFEVIDQNKLLIHIKVDTETQAFRITSRDNKRVFFVSEEIIKKNKVISLLNEYSIQLGTIVKSKTDGDTGEIEFEGSQYTYTMSDGLRKEINLFELDKNRPTLYCRLEAGQLSFLKEGYINYLLFGLVWYKFLTKQQPAFSSFAEI